MHDIAIITANFGNYDTIKEILPQIEGGTGIDWVCVTDQRPSDATLGWRYVIEPRHLRPIRAAKIPKLFPHFYTDAPKSIWIDASFRIISSRMVEDLGHLTLGQFAHPLRDCLFDEAAESVRLGRLTGKWEPDLIEAQADHYRSLGMPEHWGLWNTGFMIRDHRDKQVLRMGHRWAEEIDTWSYQDQVSQPFVLHGLDLRPEVIPGQPLGNAWVRYEGSGNHEGAPP